MDEGLFPRLYNPGEAAAQNEALSNPQLDISPRLRIFRGEEDTHDPGRSSKNQRDSSTRAETSDLKSRASQCLERSYRYSFASQNERVHAVMLELFIPGFSLIPGRTFQVEIGRSSQGDARHVDFMLEDSIAFECHVPRRWKRGHFVGDFADLKEHLHYLKLKNGLPRDDDARKLFHFLVDQHLEHNYYERRREIMNRNPDFRERELVVSATAEEFYDRVIARFGSSVPERREFLDLFGALRRQTSRRAKESERRG